MVVILCLPQAYPPTIANINYSPIALGAVLVYALVVWWFSAQYWYKGAVRNPKAEDYLNSAVGSGDSSVGALDEADRLLG